MYSDGSVSTKFTEELTPKQKKILNYLLPALEAEAEKAKSNSTYITISLGDKTLKGLMSKLKIKDGFGLAETLSNVISLELSLEKHDDDGNIELISSLNLFENMRIGGGAQNSLEFVIDPLLLSSAYILVQQK